jgi:hypothetical protein
MAEANFHSSKFLFLQESVPQILPDNFFILKYLRML